MNRGYCPVTFEKKLIATHTYHKPYQNNLKIMKNTLFAALLCGTMLMTQSCATLFTGTKDTIAINSNVKGAKIEIDGIDQGAAGTPIRVKRSLNDKMVTVKAEGYQSKTFPLQSSFNVVSILNFSNPFAWAIDLLTGAVKKYDPKAYTIELEKEAEASR